MSPPSNPSPAHTATPRTANDSPGHTPAESSRSASATASASVSQQARPLSNGQQQQQQQAQHRVRTGCLTCRRRKVKCDEEKPRCGKCRIKARECIWPGSESATSAASKRDATGQPVSVPSSIARPISRPTLDLTAPLPSPHHSRPHTTLSAQTQHTSPHSLGHRQTTVVPNALQTTSSTSNNNHLGTASTSNTSHHVNVSTSTSTVHHPVHPPDPDPTDPFQLPFNFDNFFSPPSQLPFDPSSFLDLLPILPVQQSNRFYVPPDFLPKTALVDHYKALASDDHLENLVAPRKKAEMMADPAFLQPYFRTIEERLVMRHFLLHAVHNIMAFECERRPWNPWVEILAPLAFNYLPGASSASDALRAALLAIGAVHLRYCHDSTDQKGAWKIVKVAKAKVLSLVKQCIDVQDATGTSLEKGEVELILAALLSCTIASSLAADDSWHELLTSVLALVERLGGAQNLLKEGSHERLSSFRFFLEQLAIRDVFGCMTTEMAPTILNTAFSPWFFEAEGWSKGDHEWESVERMFGMSRGMVDLIARSCTLIAKVRKEGVTIPDQSPSTSTSTSTDFSLRLPPRAVARLSEQSPTRSKGGNKASEAITTEGNGLIAELNVWDKASNFSPFHPRTQYGNHSYRHAIRIRLLREVYAVPKEDHRVQASIKAIVELATELISSHGRITWLTWPIVIAAFNMLPGDPDRATVIMLLSEFGHFACFDNGAAYHMVNDFWKHESTDAGVSTPAQVANRLKSKPFFD